MNMMLEQPCYDQDVIRLGAPKAEIGSRWKIADFARDFCEAGLGMTEKAIIIGKFCKTAAVLVVSMAR